jgi:hypothetical protein
MLSLLQQVEDRAITAVAQRVCGYKDTVVAPLLRSVFQPFLLVAAAAAAAPTSESASSSNAQPQRTLLLGAHTNSTTSLFSILHGMPGAGKTAMARAIAQATTLPFCFVKVGLL